jgi:hypothetical protein
MFAVKVNIFRLCAAGRDQFDVCMNAVRIPFQLFSNWIVSAFLGRGMEVVDGVAVMLVSRVFAVNSMNLARHYI